MSFGTIKVFGIGQKPNLYGFGILSFSSPSSVIDCETLNANRFITGDGTRGPGIGRPILLAGTKPYIRTGPNLFLVENTGKAYTWNWKTRTSNMAESVRLYEIRSSFINNGGAPGVNTWQKSSNFDHWGNITNYDTNEYTFPGPNSEIEPETQQEGQKYYFTMAAITDTGDAYVLTSLDEQNKIANFDYPQSRPPGSTGWKEIIYGAVFRAGRPKRCTYFNDADCERQGYAFGLTNDGQLWAWGRNEDGCLGTGKNNAYVDPTRVNAPGETATTWKSVSTAWGTTLGVHSNGKLYGWGRNARKMWFDNQYQNMFVIENNTSNVETVPKLIPTDITSGFDMVYVGGGAFSGLGTFNEQIYMAKSGQFLYTWGANAFEYTTSSGYYSPAFGLLGNVYGLGSGAAEPLLDIRRKGGGLLSAANSLVNFSVNNVTWLRASVMRSVGSYVLLYEGNSGNLYRWGNGHLANLYYGSCAGFFNFPNVTTPTLLNGYKFRQPPLAGHGGPFLAAKR